MLETLAYALGLKFRENTFVYYPAVQLDANRVSNDVAEKGRRIFAFSLAQVAVLHSGFAEIGIKGFDFVYECAWRYRTVGQGFDLHKNF
jgi:hypothetical protein